jgi:hypothetical protein
MFKSFSAEQDIAAFLVNMLKNVKTCFFVTIPHNIDRQIGETGMVSSC